MASDMFNCSWRDNIKPLKFFCHSVSLSCLIEERQLIFTARCYASTVQAMGLCLSVRPSVTSRCSVETDERIQLVFGLSASFHPSYTVLKGNSVNSKNKGASLWNFVLNSGLRKFSHGHGISIVETCYELSSRMVDTHSVINWAIVGQLSW